MGKVFLSKKIVHFIVFTFIFILALASASALVEVSPASLGLSICPGDNFSINITVSGVSGVYGFQFDLSYNSSVLEVISVTNGTFLSNNGQNSVFCLQPDVSTAGLIDDVACSRIGESGSTPASGVLATIRFRLRSISSYPVTSSFVISNLKLSDMDSNALSDSKADGQASITCTCSEGQSRSCTATNGCAGTQVCTGGNYGSCVTTTPFFCDSNCDGTSECRAQNCTHCQCTGSGLVSCTADGGCAGTRACTNGTLGACHITGYYCDSDCDGTNETCSATACADCGCIENWDCDAWGTCSDGYQTRTCSDLNDCGTDDSKPTDSRSCTLASSGSGSGGGGGGIIPTRSCAEAWSCDEWDACGIDGFRRRTCVDSNNCGTYVNKSNELETCVYQGNCNDGIMNNQEEGIDCGGMCTNPCTVLETTSLPLLNLMAEPITAEILDQYHLTVSVENFGEEELLDVEVAANKWSMEQAIISSILPGLTEQAQLVLNLPVNPDESSLDIQLAHEGVVVASQTISVSLSIPEFSVKIYQDPETQRTYQAVIVDNRNKPARTIEVDFTINKGKETYMIETGKSYYLEDNSVFHQVDYLYQTLPAGDYEVKSVLYESGQKIGESSSSVAIGGDKKALNVKYFFYALLLAIVAVSGYVFFVTGKKMKEI